VHKTTIRVKKKSLYIRDEKTEKVVGTPLKRRRREKEEQKGRENDRD